MLHGECLILWDVGKNPFWSCCGLGDRGGQHLGSPSSRNPSWKPFLKSGDLQHPANPVSLLFPPLEPVALSVWKMLIKTWREWSGRDRSSSQRAVMWVWAFLPVVFWRVVWDLTFSRACALLRERGWGLLGWNGELSAGHTAWKCCCTPWK